MAAQTLTLAGKEYVLIPRRRYEELTRRVQDEKDALTAKRGRKRFDAGKAKTLSHVDVKRKLGL